MDPQNAALAGCRTFQPKLDTRRILLGITMKHIGFEAAFAQALTRFRLNRDGYSQRTTDQGRPLYPAKRESLTVQARQQYQQGQ